ncbi:hypothetical protein LR48_Vigan03g031900 [Vigna angularis]|uniref:Uncharacterized protein n=1 Tax=Phaseolus angularis TaxID=3914 RepID=A0A0L9U2B4_PHAAN|nr:hypothetical protein LR48_Vigan03g031900 [Vigna angularis]
MTVSKCSITPQKSKPPNSKHHEKLLIMQVAPRVHVAVPTVALGMVGVSDAGLKVVGKVLKGAQTFARPMAEESDVAGEMESVNKGMIAPGLFRGLVAAASTACSSFENNSSSGVSVVSDSNDSMETPAQRHLIPKEVLVPLSMKSPSYSNFLTAKKPDHDRNCHSSAAGCSTAQKGLDFNLPEGRVHGGDLMLYFGGNLKNALDSI